MKLTEYGKKVRKGRIDAGVTMLEMAKDIGVAPSYLSATEVGTKKISSEFLKKVSNFFSKRGITIQGLAEAADVSNRSVSLEGLSTSQQFLVAGFARMNLSEEQVAEMFEVLSSLQKETK